MCLRICFHSFRVSSPNNLRNLFRVLLEASGKSRHAWRSRARAGEVVAPGIFGLVVAAPRAPRASPTAPSTTSRKLGTASLHLVGIRPNPAGECHAPREP